MGESHTQGAGVVALGVLSFTSVPVTGVQDIPGESSAPPAAAWCQPLHPCVFLALNPCASPSLASRKGLG